MFMILFISSICMSLKDLGMHVCVCLSGSWQNYLLVLVGVCVCVERESERERVRERDWEWDWEWVRVCVFACTRVRVCVGADMWESLGIPVFDANFPGESKWGEGRIMCLWIRELQIVPPSPSKHHLLICLFLGLAGSRVSIMPMHTHDHTT